MYPLELINASAGALNPSQFLTPYLPLIGVIAGAIVVGVFNAHNRRKGNVETRAPDVNEMWQQERLLAKELDAERKIRRKFENFSWLVLQTFRSYVNRILAGGTKELTYSEQSVYDTDPPTSTQGVATQEQS
jgi:hypothetical protein